jgi:hypothetical protein
MNGRTHLFGLFAPAAAMQDDVVTGLRKPQRNGAPDAAAGARNQNRISHAASP